MRFIQLRTESSALRAQRRTWVENLNLEQELLQLLQPGTWKVRHISSAVLLTGGSELI